MSVSVANSVSLNGNNLLPILLEAQHETLCQATTVRISRVSDDGCPVLLQDIFGVESGTTALILPGGGDMEDIGDKLYLVVALWRDDGQVCFLQQVHCHQRGRAIQKTRPANQTLYSLTGSRSIHDLLRY